MIDADRLRVYFNRFDRWFDRSSILTERRVRSDVDAPGRPVTAREAFRHVWPIVRRTDRAARLKLITGSENLDGSGRASRWEFFFDLPKRRARAAADWILPWHDEMDAFGSPRVDLVVRPFPAAESVLYQMVDEGRLLYRQLHGHWRDEMQKSPVLPHDFRDSDAVLRECTEQGLDPGTDEVTLSAGGRSERAPVWTAQTRHASFQISLR